MFSDKAVAEYINNNFEPVWQSVRPVPTVTIDFGNGKTLVRTLKGNIATYVCTAPGRVLDILPGIYNAKEFVASLDQMLKLHSQVANKFTDGQDKILVSYHERKAKTLAKSASHSLSRGKIRTESVDDVARSPVMSDDVAFNQSVRRKQIHDRLAKAGVETPEMLTKWLYREVLHSDLDDPYLGLKDELFSTDPFDKKLSLNAK